MKCRNLFMILYAITPVAVIIRLFQVLKYTDCKTGFFSADYLNKAEFSTIVFVVLIIIASALTLTVKRCPLKIPRVSPSLGVASGLLFAVVMLKTYYFALSILSGKSSFSLVWLLLVDFATAVFLLFYAAKAIYSFHIKRICYVAPLVFFISNLLVFYVKTSRMSLIPENVFYVLAAASTTVFFLYFAKIANTITTKNSHKILFFFGMLSIVFSEAFSIPQLVSLVVNKNTYLHNELSTYLLFFVSGIFVLVFLKQFFRTKNLEKHSSDSDNSKILPY